MIKICGDVMELKKRKPVRLQDYDYSSLGVYFITVCVKDRKALFWDNVGATSGRPQEIKLSKYGKIVDDAYAKFQNVTNTLK